MTTEQIINELKSLKVEYEKLVEEYETKGTLNFEDTETYGVYVGKVEICDYLLNKIKQ